MRPALRPAHILVGCLALGLMAAATFHVTQQSRSPVRQADLAPWIGLPRTGMDAETPEVRTLIWTAYEFEGGRDAYRALASQCGNLYRDTGITERYVARVGESTFSTPWKVVMDVKGDTVDITWSEGGSLPPPVPEELYDRFELVTPIATASKPLADMQHIRNAWQDDSLWHAPQDATAFSCLDGNPVFLEACVAGRYGARASDCNARSSAATAKLWRALNDVLPPPPKQEWRDARGSRIKPPDPRD